MLWKHPFKDVFIHVHCSEMFPGELAETNQHQDLFASALSLLGLLGEDPSSQVLCPHLLMCNNRFHPGVGRSGRCVRMDTLTYVKTHTRPQLQQEPLSSLDTEAGSRPGEQLGEGRGGQRSIQPWQLFPLGHSDSVWSSDQMASIPV